jgi:hypothetical protein
LLCLWILTFITSHQTGRCCVRSSVCTQIEFKIRFLANAVWRIAIMQNIFYNRKITRTSTEGVAWGRFAAHMRTTKDDATTDTACVGGPEWPKRRALLRLGSFRSWGDRSAANDGKGKRCYPRSRLRQQLLLMATFEFTLGRLDTMNSTARRLSSR